MVIQSSIEKKLSENFSPIHLEVANESNMHNVPPGSESHFKVTLVSNAFCGERLINRHRAVNKLLRNELENGVHALALHTYTEEEWQLLNGGSPESPACLGGMKKM